MTAATVSALGTAVAGIIVAVTSLLAVLFHHHDPPTGGPTSQSGE
jgi:hypothetical protein